MPLTPTNQHAWRHKRAPQILAENSRHGPAACTRLLAADVRAKRRALHAAFGIRLWPLLLPALVQLPLWLCITETLRKMCGTRDGLLGLLTKPVTGALADDDAGSEVAGGDAPTALADAVVPVEPTLALEGALWFPDLLVPDPLLILPFALSAAMFVNITYQERQRARQNVDTPKSVVRMTRALKLVALAVGPLLLDMPAALLVYWLASTAMVLGENVLLDRVMPRSVNVRPCKRKHIPYLLELKGKR